MGDSLLKDITMVQDYQVHRGSFADDDETLTDIRDVDEDDRGLARVCPRGFFQGYEGLPGINCQTIGGIVSETTETLGSTILHEYT